MTNNKLNEIEERELWTKLEMIREFLIFNNGDNYKLYNNYCPNKPDSNIIEYLDDVIHLIERLKG